MTESPPFDTAAIRELLCAAFDEKELRRFCQDRPLFRPVVCRFSSNPCLEDMADRIIDYCEKRLLWKELLYAIKEFNPRQFERFCSRLTEPAWPPGTMFLVQFIRNPDFVGRQEDLENLHLVLQGEEQVAIRPAGLTGMGGIGKTQLAVEYVYRYRDSYPAGIFWMNAAEPWDQALAALARQINPTLAATTLDEQVQTAIACLNNHPGALLVIDNVVDPADLNRLLVGTLVLGALPCRLLFTTRHRDVGHFRAVEVNVLPERPAMELLLRHPKWKAVLLNPTGDEYRQACTICQILGYLPLALEVAGAHLGRPSSGSLSVYREKLLAHGALPVLDDPSRLLQAEDLPTRHTAGVSATLASQWAELGEKAQLSLRVVSQISEAVIIPAARIGLLAGLYARQGELLDVSLDLVLDELANAGLLELLENNLVRLHPLVREFAARQTSPQNTAVFRQECAARMAIAYDDCGRLEGQCAMRGVRAVQEDLHMALGWLQLGKEEALVSSVCDLLRVLQREARVLKWWSAAISPEFFAQQVHNRALRMGLTAVSVRAKAYLAALQHPWIALEWCSEPGSAGLEWAPSQLEHSVRGVTALADAQHVAVAFSDGTLAIWDLRTGQLEGAEEGSRPIYCAAFSQDGKRAVSGSADGILAIHDLVTGSEKHIQAHTGYVIALVVTPDGLQAISASEDCTLKVWDLKTGDLKCILSGHKGPVVAVAVTPDGWHVISGAEDHEVKVWDLASGRLERTLRGHKDLVRTLAVTPDGCTVVSGSADLTLKVWHLVTGRLERTLRWHRTGGIVVAVMPDGQCIVSGDYSGNMKVWDVVTGREKITRKIETRLTAVTVTADGQRVVLGFEDGALVAWNVASAQNEQSQDDHRGIINAVALTRDRNRAVSSSYDRILKIWNLATGQVERTLHGCECAVKSIVVLPNGHAISGGVQRTLCEWDLTSGQKVRVLRGHGDRVAALAVTPDGQTMVSGGGEGDLKVWNIATGRVTRALVKGREHETICVAISADGLWVAGCMEDGRIEVWHIRPGWRNWLASRFSKWSWRDWQGFGPKAVVIAGRKAISASWRGRLQIWDLNSGDVDYSSEEVRALSLAATPDGQRLVCGVGQRVAVWNLAERREVAATSLDAQISCVTISEDGTLLMAGAENGNVYCLRYVDCVMP